MNCFLYDKEFPESKLQLSHDIYGKKIFVNIWKKEEVKE